ncbi:tRNA/tmRNA/rRNA uracil-C5-methylase (TrmA/RlmC/RlmD family) [Nocardia ignorata]|uniref:tRNA/tmRNA/rRNA uracil-C5-methylase (TrmA/RlmC/RlmD family) n=1 Tax=Nocardia ignorata TaxID=145285 RepID=A0A4R6PSK6_NOCIG|nr:tRNA/tmRNA/rRNA uracil-C5-methylase (TrmA/RlmC/RlmD family) [Nocardia ignorata]
MRLGAPGHGGFCVGRHEGRVVFVRHGLPGELVRARVTEDRGGSFCRADAVEIIEASADRVPATCPVSGPGGAGCCDFSFATPAAQRALKATVVAEQLRRLAGVEREIEVEPIGDEVVGGWRTRVRLVVDAAGRAGVHRYRSTEVIPDLRCPQPVAGALDGVAERSWTPGADLVVAVDGDGVRHIVELAPAAEADRAGTRPATPRGGTRGRGQRPARHRESGRPADERGAVRDRAAARKSATNAPREEWVMAGSGRAVEYVAGRRWELSATGFWQAHHGAAQRYSDLVAEWSGLEPGGSGWDLYSGVGVFAARLGEQTGQTGAVSAVESARSAVADGTAALRDLPWVQLHAGRVERWAREATTTPDVVVLDPPRAGAGKEVVAAVTDADPRRIIHIGCDPASFARDLGLYLDAGYHLAELRAFDAFPVTHHVECVALLDR